MTYFLVCVIGIVLIIIAIAGMTFKKHIVVDIIDQLKKNQITISGPGNTSITINASSKDRETAWKIYAQMSTRIATVDFNDKYDALLIVNDSLYKLFNFIRENTVDLPLSVLNDDRNCAISLYLSILNLGIRPYLSKWHIPVTHWHEKMKKGNDSLSIIQIEANMPERAEALNDIHAMNSRMKEYASLLLDIAKGKRESRHINAPLWDMNDFGYKAMLSLQNLANSNNKDFPSKK